MLCALLAAMDAAGVEMPKEWVGKTPGEVREDMAAYLAGMICAADAYLHQLGAHRRGSAGKLEVLRSRQEDVWKDLSRVSGREEEYVAEEALGFLAERLGLTVTVLAPGEVGVKAHVYAPRGSAPGNVRGKGPVAVDLGLVLVAIAGHYWVGVPRQQWMLLPLHRELGSCSEWCAWSVAAQQPATAAGEADTKVEADLS